MPGLQSARPDRDLPVMRSKHHAAWTTPHRAPVAGTMRAMSEGREILTYEDFGTSVRALAQDVADSGFDPTMVLCVSRGGLALGGGLAYALDLKQISAVNVEFYTGIDERLIKPVMIPPTPPASDLDGQRVLIADDVADTGRTLALVREYCRGHAAEARIAVIYEKPASELQPEYVWRKTHAWIDFPWSTLPPVTSTVEKP